MPKKIKPRSGATLCGANKKSGGVCAAYALKGAKRCRVHGGTTTTKGNKTAAAPGGIYSKYLSAEERVEYDQMEMGTVDGEIKLLRVRLQRYMREEAKNEQELETRIERVGGGPATVELERHYKHRDWRLLIAQTASRIESLERTRAELAKAAQGGGNDDLAAAMRALADRLPV